MKGPTMTIRVLLALLCTSSLSLQADTYNIYNIMPNNQVNFVNGPAVIQQNSQTQNNYAPRPGPRTIFSDNRTYHLGDENFRSRKWAPLYGQCYFIRFYDNGSPGHYYLALQRYGTESAAVFLNESPIGYLPRQYRGRRKRPNYWSATEWISIPSSAIYRGNNELAICASPVPQPEFPGDLDDFQIRHIRLIKD